MQSTMQSSNRPVSTSRPVRTAAGGTKSRRKVVLGLIGVAVLLGLAAAFLVMGGDDDAGLEYTCGSPRVIGIDLSSQARADAQVRLAADIVADHVFAAAVCRDQLTVIGVAAATPVLITVDPDAVPRLVGPNARARAQVARTHMSDIHDAAVAALDAAYKTYKDVDTTSVPALYDAVAAHAAPHARIVLVTTGVHDASDVSLNRPLAKGDGAAAAAAMTWPALPHDATVSVIGVGQMDGTVPAPGELWPREVVAFNEAACKATKADTCHVFQVATANEAQL